jgi:ABC-type phosphate transport system substrate-binding protein
MSVRFHLPALLALLAVLAAPPAAADLVVVVNTGSGVERLSRDEVINIFLGRYRQFPSGLAALPIDQPAEQPLKAQFYRQLVNKDLAEINAYWARLIFSGKTSPPRQAASPAEVVAWLAHNRGAIGYVERGMVDARLRIVMEFEP